MADSPLRDPSADIYAMLDEAKLTGGQLLNSKANMATIVNKIRGDIALKFKSYVVRREHAAYNAGVQKGRSDGEPR